MHVPGTVVALDLEAGALLEFPLLGPLPSKGMGLVGWFSFPGILGLESSGFPGLPGTPAGGSVTTMVVELSGFNLESFAWSPPDLGSTVWSRSDPPHHHRHRTHPRTLTAVNHLEGLISPKQL